ncbi:MAG: hydrogenase iron-sulfur subunit [Bacteroidetes bacterium]|jgi:quinone-modifying oxidoreductase, subunit QmoB|nr:hydrogenase iron-sulfur subunit [Bacteroidota bacterium]MBT4401672.1 hydrogenase iron-sulfur subunit [Bacteroidota bacterium]MBT4408851.1 hydrogenase iron-sulfur subunit [Bacteroidota bacterium]MBT5425027.1 hydrogenase iron-sulfur subunit [Bacteroidota bacterium]MBT7092462.1 hydrogenase iron-sulfur subunit [Bacteroidota bacterium]
MSVIDTISVFICSGCEIGTCLDCSGLEKIARENTDVTKVVVHDRLCHEEGLDLIREGILENPGSSVLIAACSPRIKTTEFSFGSEIQLERVNIREQVVYCQPAGEEDTQMMAEDYLRMGMAKLKFTQLPTAFIPEITCMDILVVGGGITGLTSALEGANAGYSVVLIEKEESLGGFLKNLNKTIPNKAPWVKEQKNDIDSTISEVIHHEGIRVITGSKIESIGGQPGDFTVSVSNNDQVVTFKVGSIVAATGWKPYNPNKLEKFGYGSSLDIISNHEAEEAMKNGVLLRRSDGMVPKSVLFVQCAGSRDPDHLPYCSSICCGTSLKQAKIIREQHPETSVFLIYKDIRMPGMLEQYYKEVQKDSRIFLTKGIVEKVVVSEKQLSVEVSESLIDEDISIPVDMVILATGMVPNDSKELNLAYRQGPGLPELKYEFSDSHFICFPYETRRTGIYAAGAMRAPMGISDSQTDARGAVMKAVQLIESVKKGGAVHPRSGDRSYPQLYMQRCTDCKRCTEECPFGMYDETEKGTPLPNPTRCRRCGICMGSCPERIISFEDFSIQSVSAMIKSIHVPDEFEEKPRILAFVCENDAYPAFDMAGMKRLQYSAFIRIIPVRCIGSINKIWISDALSQGFDGIMQIGCKPGDDYQCHFIQGSELTETRGENIQETLQTMMLEPERIRTEFVEINEFDRIPEIINDYIEEIELIGPNPFKEI